MEPKITICLLLLAFIACFTNSDGCCPERFMQVGEDCYYYSGERKGWHDADDTCRTLGAHLVSIHSAAESQLVYNLYKNLAKSPATRDDAYWIGLHDTASEGNFVWTDGTPLDYYNWLTGNPDNEKEEDCVGPRNDGSNDYDRQKWNDYDCDWKKSFFCRRPL